MAGKEFKQRIRQALNNASLRGALGRFADSYVVSREEVYAGRDFESLRQRIAAIKADAAGRYEELADRFSRVVEARGGKVFRAKDAAAAREYIYQVAKEHGVTEIVKSKSFASEEIHLNEFLQERGINPYETDLAEWILQLMPGERPSHMVMPAIHLPKEEVARVFSRYLGEPVEPDIKNMVRIARRELRKKFLTAGMGISGANIAVAETGTIVLCTNEGNARLTTTVPPVHVAIVGYEKLVPSIKDIVPILEALPRSGTAQPITSYVTMITGPVPAWRGEGEGIKELHVVLLDNGRTRMAADPVFKEALQCIRCASCTNVCPVFQLVSGQVYGYIYNGGIGSVLTAFFNSLEDAVDPQSLCIGCRRCAEVCPAKINIPDLVLKLRERVITKQGLSSGYRIALHGIVAKPKLMHTLLRAASRLQGPVTHGQPLIRHLPLFFSNLTSGRSLPAIAKEPLRDRVKRLEARTGRPRLKAAFYSGCVIDFAYPEIGEAVYKVLGREGVQVTFPQGQACCGAPAVYAGDRETAVKLAKQNITALEEARADVVVTACPTCAVALKKDFPELLAGEPAWEERARALAKKVKDFTELVHELTGGQGKKVKQAKKSGSRAVKVTYHDSCHFKRHLGLDQVARQVLKEQPGVELVEMQESDRCCGFGGSYSIKYPEISAPILERKLKNITESGAEVVAADCPGCVLQLRGGLDQKGSSIKVKHTAEVLAALENLQGGGNSK
ncbi:L-lactate dehydrogenase (quinone) large subunit LdhH [Neomoorella thermoacetica]|uniref:L-lactate dehydrogenase (quinone) large subunit LdhH n=1 Tax=Neomoorella thermoacetica TaxID=1525 RepID=UPI0008FAE821|nr:LUD domain-containing protein [Moorella thermoacetica]APC09508.1 lactate utilization protein B [Moorella thermoacetica]